MMIAWSYQRRAARALAPGRPRGDQGRRAPAIIVRRSTSICLRGSRAFTVRLVVGAMHLRINRSDGHRPRPHHDSRAHGRGRRRGASPEEPRRVHRPAGGAGEPARVRPCREEPRRGARPCPAPRPARPRQDDAGRHPRPRDGRRLPRHLRPGDRQVGRPRRPAHQPRGRRRPVHRRDPPPQPRRSRKCSIRRWRTARST